MSFVRSAGEVDSNVEGVVMASRVPPGMAVPRGVIIEFSVVEAEQVWTWFKNCQLITGQSALFHSLSSDYLHMSIQERSIKCNIFWQLEFGDRTILSNCHLSPDLSGTSIPSNAVFHTIPIKGSEFVTISFALDQNMKVAFTEFQFWTNIGL